MPGGIAAVSILSTATLCFGSEAERGKKTILPDGFELMLCHLASEPGDDAGAVQLATCMQPENMEGGRGRRDFEMGVYVAASRCSQDPMNHNVCGNSKILIAHTVVLFIYFFNFLLTFLFSNNRLQRQMFFFPFQKD